tara:strand:+ start:203 stop:937 length:735 start_codon:yes stop_codon:yes gene_type:complete
MKNQKKFYDNLMDEKSHFTFFTKDTRFNVEKLLTKKNIIIHFDEYVKNFISINDKILDYGCGPGTFSVKLSNMTKGNVYGVDISKNFIDECERLKKKLDIKNFIPRFIENEALPFEDNTFDIILLFDVIHHLDDIDKNLIEIKRVLKKSGKIIIYEPNKLNPLIALMHLIDSNERGLLKVGTKKKYFDILTKYQFKKIHQKYSGIIVGPESRMLNLLSSILNNKYVYQLFGWLNPKIVIIVEND